ncbi:MAG TPA: DUF72 domain-containing protein [Candidatus Binataceae bacterium]|jgi:uncharacterized protein YecE (DUF72 family)|nr:DUF72 domain-containing protein [Candidatus Binataceae bacterium]
MARLFVGTSGWNYYGWRGSFYPEDLPSRQWLSYYARRFNSVELNYSFYRLPRRATYENWLKQVPPGFELAVKVWRAISQAHLDGIDERWRAFVEPALALDDRLGPFLLQLPPSYAATPERLDRLAHFLKLAARTRQARIAVEFRHSSCFADEVLELLRQHDAALVIAHSSRYPSPAPAATTRFVYFRFHGPRELFASSYSDAELRRWAAIARKYLEEGRDVYAYFNNDVGGYALSNAQTLMKQVGWDQGVARARRVAPRTSRRSRTPDRSRAPRTGRTTAR